ncbi:MAG: alpha-(1-2)-phosphatidylinositol mannosyltransferase [Pseudonocardiales bacterium]|nr:MAG: alpha-(1-2)-phosphatidylinositol mannosyltransferase [Pseudonocardiales bacterium]
MTRTLVVTNDFPPRAGGIQAFVHSLVSRQPADSVLVYTSSSEGAAAFDAAQAFPIVRHPGSMLLPTPAVARVVSALARTEGCDAALFGAAAPLGLLAPFLRAGGVDRQVALTHGHEVGWAALPGARALLRRIGTSVDVVTYLGAYTRSRLAMAMGPAVRLERLAPGVDTSTFSPSVDGSAVRARLGLAGRPVVVCVSRLVARKGQDILIRSLPAIRSAVPGAALLLVGGGPDRSRLQRLAAASGVGDDVVFTGPAAWPELPSYFAAGDVFAMPCRTRRRGLDVEGLGMVYLEASATGLPVVAGDSGGAPDAVLEGETGFVVDGRSVDAVADRVSTLLADPALARAMGDKGRAWVERDWRWDMVAERLAGLLQT